MRLIRLLGLLVFLGSVCLASCGPRIKPGADLSGRDFSGKDLREANFREGSKRAILREANLSKANLERVRLSGVDLSHADLSEANLAGAHLDLADLSHANLSEANLAGAHLDLADLSHADLSGADLSGASLNTANLDGADLSGATLFKTDLSGAKGVTDEMLGGAASGGTLWLPEARNGLASICQGNGIPEAADYDDSSNTHTVMVIAPSEEERYRYEDNRSLPDHWYPSEIGSLQLVACKREPDWKQTQNCTYTDGTSTRMLQRIVNVDLVEAKTGNVVASGTLLGPSPGSCSSIKPYGYTDSITQGGEIRPHQIRYWLTPYVDPTRGIGFVGTITFDSWRFEIIFVGVDPMPDDETRKMVTLLGNVKNEGEEEDRFFAYDKVALQDSKGELHNYDSDAYGAALKIYHTALSLSIKPGATVTNKAIAFAVPADEKEFTITAGSSATNWSGDITLTLP